MDRYVKIVKEKLSPKRFEHSLRVMETAVEMAERFSVAEGSLNADREMLDMDKEKLCRNQERQIPDKERLRLAALLHDYAKDLPPQELLELAEKNGLLTCQAEKAQPKLLHGAVGACLVCNELGIEDEAILQAIRYHTTGHAAMTKMDAIIFLADLIEPGREYQDVAELRELCGEDINAALLFAFDSTLSYLQRRGLFIHPHTIEARNSILTKRGCP